MEELVTIAAALGDRSRLRIVNALLAGELCVCQVLELLGLAPSSVSQHLSVLRAAGLIMARKEGRWMYYRLAGKEASPAVRTALRLVRATLAADADGAADRKRLASICSIEPEVLCCNQRNGNDVCCSSAPGTPAAARWPKAGRAGSSAPRSRPTRRAPSPTG